MTVRGYVGSDGTVSDETAGRDVVGFLDVLADHVAPGDPDRWRAQAPNGRVARFRTRADAIRWLRERDRRS